MTRHAFSKHDCRYWNNYRVSTTALPQRPAARPMGPRTCQQKARANDLENVDPSPGEPERKHSAKEAQLSLRLAQRFFTRR